MAFDDPNPLPEPPVQQQPPQAQHSREQTFVSFRNTTPRYVNIYWIDYNGRRSFYAILRPGADIKANTFVTHPWIFRDAQTGEYMQALRQEVFWPQIYRTPHPTLANQWIMARKMIEIHLPVDLLSRRCLWKCAQRLREESDGKIVWENMAIPTTLIKDLKQILNRIRHFESEGGIWIQGRIDR